MKLYSWYDKNSQYFQNDEGIQSHTKKNHTSNIIVKNKVEQENNTIRSKSALLKLQQSYS